MNKLIAICVTCLIVSGCSTTRLYDGPQKASHEIVTINGMSGLDPLGGFMSSIICEIDGKEIDGCASKAEIMPGTHTLKLVLKEYGMTVNEKTVTVDFKAGDKYLLGLGLSSNGKEPALFRDY